MPQSGLTAAAGALCAALHGKDPALAASAAAALGHAGLRAPLPLPLGSPAPAPAAPQAPAAQAGAAGAAVGLGAPAAAERAGAEAGGAAGPATAAAANGAAASGPGSAAALQVDSSLAETGSQADCGAKGGAPATRLAAVAGMARLMADKDPKVRRGSACRLERTATSRLLYYLALPIRWAGTAASV